MVFCMAGGSQAHEDEEPDNCVHSSDPERVTQ